MKVINFSAKTNVNFKNTTQMYIRKNIITHLGVFLRDRNLFTRKKQVEIKSQNQHENIVKCA